MSNNNSPASPTLRPRSRRVHKPKSDRDGQREYVRIAQELFKLQAQLHAVETGMQELTDFEEFKMTVQVQALTRRLELIKTGGADE